MVSVCTAPTAVVTVMSNLGLHKALAAKGFTVLNTRVSEVTPTSMLDKLPEGVKTVAGKTPVSVIVGLVAYGLYRKFFKKTPNTNA